MLRAQVPNDMQVESSRTSLPEKRGAGEAVFPSTDEVLRENDVLVLTGTHEAVAAACELLCQTVKTPLPASDGDLLG